MERKTSKMSSENSGENSLGHSKGLFSVNWDTRKKIISLYYPMFAFHSMVTMRESAAWGTEQLIELLVKYRQRWKTSGSSNLCEERIHWINFWRKPKQMRAFREGFLMRTDCLKYEEGCIQLFLGMLKSKSYNMHWQNVPSRSFE